MNPPHDHTEKKNKQQNKEKERKKGRKKGRKTQTHTHTETPHALGTVVVTINGNVVCPRGAGCGTKPVVGKAVCA
jgi:hypothetical protein